MPWMSAIAFWVSPWPSAYSKSVTLGHFEASSRADAVVTRRQLLPPKPSVMPRTISSGPHHEGTSPLAAAPPDEACWSSEPPPQAARVRTPTLRSASGLAGNSRFTGRFLSESCRDGRDVPGRAAGQVAGLGSAGLRPNRPRRALQLTL